MASEPPLLEPLYPLFLAGARWPLEDRPLPVQGRRRWWRRWGDLSLQAHARAHGQEGRRRRRRRADGLYPLLVRHAVAGVESALLTTLLIAFAYQFVTIRTVWGAAATGAWLGLAVLTRAVALPLVLAAPLVSAFRSGRTADAVTMASVTILVLAPFGLRNYTLNGTIIPARGGVNLFISNCEYAPGVVATYGADILLTYAESKLAAEGLLDLPPTPDLERQQDAAYFRLALAEIRRHPGNTLALKIRNVFDFFSPILVPHRETTDATTIRFGQSGQSTIEHTVARPLAHRVAYSASYGLVLALAAFGVYVRRRGLAADSDPMVRAFDIHGCLRRVLSIDALPRACRVRASVLCRRRHRRFQRRVAGVARAPDAISVTAA